MYIALDLKPRPGQWLWVRIQPGEILRFKRMCCIKFWNEQIIGCSYSTLFSFCFILLRQVLQFQIAKKSAKSLLINSWLFHQGMKIYKQKFHLRVTRGARNPNLNNAITNACAAVIQFAPDSILFFSWTSTKIVWNAKNTIQSQACWPSETYAKQQCCLQWHTAIKILNVQNMAVFTFYSKLIWSVTYLKGYANFCWNSTRVRVEIYY